MLDDPYRILYDRGILGPWYLRPSQLELYKLLKIKKKITVLTHRRYGKGTCTYLHCVEECLTRTINVRVGAPTIIQAHSIFDFLLAKIFYRAPDLKPVKRQGFYEFANGSKIYLFGVADSSQLDRGRGVESEIIVCDEFGFYQFRPEYVLKSVLLPQTMNCNGQLIITSTPPDDMAHYFTEIVIQSELEGNLFKWDIMDSFRVGEKTKEDLEKIIEDCGGKDSEHFRREYMCDMIACSERLVIPEAQETELYVGKQDRPSHFDSYFTIDLGLIDYSFAVFGYLDFKQNRMIIEDELMVNYTTTSALAELCKAKEKELEYVPYRRIGDCEQQQLFDLVKDHDYPVTPITKRSKMSGKGFRDSVINQLRMAIKEGKILIDPDKCPNLCKQLLYGIWTERRNDFERSETLGHLDGMVALSYLIDNIDWHKNPYPHKYDGHSQATHHIQQEVLDMRKDRKSYGSLLGR